MGISQSSFLSRGSLLYSHARSTRERTSEDVRLQALSICRSAASQQSYFMVSYSCWTRSRTRSLDDRRYRLSLANASRQPRSPMGKCRAINNIHHPGWLRESLRRGYAALGIKGPGPSHQSSAMHPSNASQDDPCFLRSLQQKHPQRINT